MPKKELPITSGIVIGLLINNLIEKIEQAKSIMMSDKEYDYLLSRVDDLREAIENIRRWGM